MRPVCLLLAVLALLPGAVRAADLTTDLSADHVDITTGFNGTNLIVYGVQRKKGVIAVTLRGPERTMVVRRKGQVLGAWINVESIEFHRVPGYYDFAQSDTLHEGLAGEKGIGLSALDFYPEERLSENEAKRFREALIRNKQQQGLFPLQGRDVSVIEQGFFKVVFPLPANMPTGTYRVDTYLIDGSRIAAQAQKTLQVGQVGFSARIYLFARDHALLYGFMAVALAFIAGWGAFTFLRRD